MRLHTVLPNTYLDKIDDYETLLHQCFVEAKPYFKRANKPRHQLYKLIRAGLIKSTKNKDKYWLSPSGLRYARLINLDKGNYHARNT
jgi:hypothetical protein